MTTQNLSGKVALIQGGSRGIGAAIVKRLAAEGAAVAFTYVSSAAKAEELQNSITANGGKALAIKADSADAEAIRSAVTATNGFGVGAVGLDGEGFAAVGGDAVLQFFSLGGGADVSKGDCRAFSGQAFDYGGADTAGSALNQSYFTAEVLSGHVDLQKIQGGLPCCWSRVSASHYPLCRP